MSDHLAHLLSALVRASPTAAAEPTVAASPAAAAAVPLLPDAFLPAIIAQQSPSNVRALASAAALLSQSPALLQYLHSSLLASSTAAFQACGGAQQQQQLSRQSSSESTTPSLPPLLSPDVASASLSSESANAASSLALPLSDSRSALPKVSETQASTSASYSISSLLGSESSSAQKLPSPASVSDAPSASKAAGCGGVGEKAQRSPKEEANNNARAAQATLAAAAQQQQQWSLLAPSYAQSLQHSVLALYQEILRGAQQQSSPNDESPRSLERLDSLSEQLKHEFLQQMGAMVDQVFQKVREQLSVGEDEAAADDGPESKRARTSETAADEPNAHEFRAMPSDESTGRLQSVADASAPTDMLAVLKQLFAAQSQALALPALAQRTLANSALLFGNPTLSSNASREPLQPAMAPWGATPDPQALAKQTLLGALHSMGALGFLAPPDALQKEAEGAFGIGSGVAAANQLGRPIASARPSLLESFESLAQLQPNAAMQFARKKRSKVTDTRLSPRAVKAILQSGASVGSSGSGSGGSSGGGEKRRAMVVDCGGGRVVDRPTAASTNVFNIQIPHCSAALPTQFQQMPSPPARPPPPPPQPLVQLQAQPTSLQASSAAAVATVVSANQPAPIASLEAAAAAIAGEDADSIDDLADDPQWGTDSSMPDTPVPTRVLMYSTRTVLRCSVDRFPVNNFGAGGAQSDVAACKNKSTPGCCSISRRVQE